jgi:glucosamine 6-phosphate synthetase-like amidotransferase/phosphosugar isomerase protein
LIDLDKIDYLIELPPCKDTEEECFAALQMVVPLQLICYLTTKKRGYEPDQQILKAIDFANELE